MTKAIFIDTGNLCYCISKKFDARRLDYSKLLELAPNCKSKYAYVSHMNDQAVRFISYLEDIGFTVRVKHPRKRKVHGEFVWETDWKIELTLDTIDYDHVVLATNDQGFMPLVDDLLDQNCEIELIAAGVPKSYSDKIPTIEIPESCLLI